MKKLIFILVITLVSCSKNAQYDLLNGEYRIQTADVLYERTGTVKYEDGKAYESTSGGWYKTGDYTYNDSIFTYTTNTGYKTNVLYVFTGSTLTFRDVNYKFNYPHGGEPKSVLIKK
jgi:hypothetical protein